MKKIIFGLLLALLISISFNYAPVHAATNLIPNNSVENSTTGLPTSWHTDFWGTNTTSFTYPATGTGGSGTKAVQVAITQYTSGDAKWYFDPVTVTPGHSYTFTDKYQSNVETEVDLELTNTSNVVSYQFLGTAPASATSWQTFTKTFTAPTNVKTVSVLHVIYSVGNLTTDDFSLVDNSVTSPTLALTSISPTSKVAGSAAFSMTINGSGFVNGTSVAYFNGAARTTTFVSATQLTAAVPASDVTTQGNYTITVKNGSLVSNSISFAVTASTNPVPTTTSLSPASATAGEAAFTLTVNGTNFVPNAVVKFNGSAKTTTYVSATQLTAAIPASDIATAGSYLVAVTNPAPGGGTSNTQTFVVSNATFCPTGSAEVVVDPTSSDGTPYVLPAAGKYHIEIYSPSTGTDSSYANYTWANWNTDNLARIDGGDVFLLLNKTVQFSNTTQGMRVSNADLTLGSSAFVDPPYNNSRQLAAAKARGSATEMSLQNGDTLRFVVNAAKNSGGQGDYVNNTGALHIRVCSVGNLVPSTTSISPISKVAGSGAFTLTVNGTNFISTSKVTFNGSVKTTTYVSATQLTAAIPASDVSAASSFSVTVANPAPGGGTSNGQTFTVTNPVVNNLILNPSFENQTGNLPTNWFQGGWGTNATTFAYPVTGSGGGTTKAAQITISSYTDGDAKWYFNPVTVTPGQFYVFSDNYMSTVATHIIVEVHASDGTLSYQDIGTPAASSSWKAFSAGFTAPSNASSIVVYHLINAVGSLTVDDYSLVATNNPNAFAKGMVTLSFDDGWQSVYDNALPILNAAGFKSTQYIITNYIGAQPDYVTLAEIQNMKNQGHDIQAHTETHPDLTKLSATDLQNEVQGSRTALLNLGFSPANSLAYPYGQYNAAVEQAVQSAGFTAARTVNFGFNDKSTPNYELKGTAVERGGTCDGGAAVTTLADVKSWIDSAALGKTWLVLVLHQTDTDPASCYGIDPTFLQNIVNYLKTSNVDVVTVSQGLAQK